MVRQGGLGVCYRFNIFCSNQSIKIWLWIPFVTTMGRLGTPLPSWHPPWNSCYWRGQQNHVSVWTHTHKSSYFIINCIVIYYDLFCPWSAKKNLTGLAVASSLANIEPFKKRVSWGVFGINREEVTVNWSCIKQEFIICIKMIESRKKRRKNTHGRKDKCR